ncbi:MAG: S8 family serine peptidase, partial [Phycisphaerales bacterium]|nr:S8 family serine peptidase [Phycisphaerales bacterium]
MHETVSRSDSLRQIGSSRERSLGALTVFLGALALGHATPRATGQQVIPRPQAEVIARQKGWPIRKVTALGGIIELQKIVNGIPFYYVTYNRTAADTVSTDECWPGGSTNLSLTGAGVKLGIWDGGGVLTTHQEFGGRAVQSDVPPGFLDHSTHVAGTMIGAGLSLFAGTGRPAGQSKGMSFAASLDCYDWNSDTNEMAAAAAAGLLASNHSYGLSTGWYFGNLGAGQGWYWYGDVNVSTFEDYFFGFYSLESASWDTIAYKKPYYLIVKAAGNDRNYGPAPGTTHFVSIGGNWVLTNTVRSLNGNNGYDSISHSGLSKNILSVGAVGDVIGGYAGPGSVVMSSFSSWGPADDGRIKPDVVGNGIDLYSASSASDTAYIGKSGTSMSSPNVTGSLGLLIQHYGATHGGANMRAATLKGLVVHTADECGSATGPDYSFGWGLVNTAAAANVIALNQTVPGTMQELALANGDFIEQIWTSSGSGPIRVTICWTDPPGTPPPPALDRLEPALVNDVDLRLVGPDST